VRSRRARRWSASIPGAALLDLDRPDRALCFVIGEDVQVRAGSKAEDEVFEAEEPAGVRRGRGLPVQVRGEADGGQCPVAGDQVLQEDGVQGGLPRLAGGRGGVAGLDQQARHLRCPLLPGWLEVVQALQVPQQVNPAPGVQRIGQVPVTGVAVPDDDALVTGQHAAASIAPADRSPVCRQVRYLVQARCTYRVPPAARAGASSACTAGAVFSSSRTRSMNPLASTSEAARPRIPAIHPVETAIPASWHSSSVDRQTGMWWPAGQVRGLRAGLRPEAGAGTDVRGQRALGDRPAAGAFLSLRHVLGDPRRRRRGDAGDLMTTLRQHRCPGQARAAPAARRRRELEPLVRVIDQVHRRPRLARLLARPPLPRIPQRPVGALLIRAVRRRRPRRRGRIPAGPTLKIFHPGGQPPDLRGQPGDQLVRLSQPGRQLGGPAALTAPQLKEHRPHRTHLAMITIPARQSTTHPGAPPRTPDAAPKPTSSATCKARPHAER
jgi:hypothetical protein